MRHAATGGDVEGAVGPGAAHRAHSVSDGAHPAMPMARRAGVQHQFAGTLGIGHRPQCPDREPVQCRGRGVFLAGQPLGGLQDRAGAGVAPVVVDDVGGEGVDGDHLGDDVEIAAGVQLDVDVREGLQPGAELAAVRRTPLATARTKAVVAGQQGDDAVGLTELVLAQHDRPIPIQPH